MNARRARSAIALSLVLSAACGDGGTGAAPPRDGASGSSTTTSASATSGTGGSGGSSDAGGGGAGGAPVDPWAGPLEALAKLSLGELAIDELHSFPIPDRSLGLLVVAYGPTPTDVLGIHQLRPPSGGDVVFEYAVVGHAVQAFGNAGVAAAANPQSDLPQAVPVQAGRWSVRIGDGGQGLPTADVDVWVRRTNDGAFHGGALDMNVFLAPGTVDEAYMSEVLASVFPYAGIAQGRVVFYDTDAAYSYIDSYAEFLEMLETTAGVRSAPAVNVFVVGDFDKSDFKAAKGASPGIPGLAIEHGTPLSGMAFQPTGDAAHDARVVAHELGHLAGLFHTSELKIDENDPLGDTPECPFDMIQVDPTACPDRDNVMFPVTSDVATFTPAQEVVVRASALYRGALEEGAPAAASLSPIISPADAQPRSRGSVSLCAISR